MSLAEIERDALAETFNLALGEAVGTLSEMVHDEVWMSVPGVELLTRGELVERLGGADGEVLSSISQKLRGPDRRFSADACLLFSHVSHVELVRKLLADETAGVDGGLSDLAQDALAEVANLIINAFLGTVAEMSGVDLVGSLPHTRQGRAHALVPVVPDGQRVLSAKIGITVLGRPINGVVVLTLGDASLAWLLERVRSYFGLPEEATA